MYTDMHTEQYIIFNFVRFLYENNLIFAMCIGDLLEDNFHKHIPHFPSKMYLKLCKKVSIHLSHLFCFH